MKSLYETFTDKEFKELQKAKHSLNNGQAISWRQYLLISARGINKAK